MPKRNKLVVLLLSFVLITVSLLLLVFPSFKSEAVDPEPPVLVDFALSSDEIDSDDNPGEINVYARVSDTSGIQDASVYLRPIDYDDEDNPETQQLSLYLNLLVDACGDLGEIIDTSGLTGCGTENDGIYGGVISLPYGSTLGEWKVQELSLNAQSGAWSAFLYQELETMYGVGSATFDNIGSVEDTEGPVIVSYSFDNSIIDTTLEDQVLVLTVNLTDNISGLAEEITLDFKAVLGDHYKSFGLELISGDKNDGVYEGELTMDRWSPIGKWALFSMSSDILGNNGTLPVEEDEVFFTNNATIEDIVSPTIKSLVIDKSKFDTSEGDETITLTMELEDDVSGIDISKYSSYTNFGPVFDWWNSGVSSNDLELLSGSVKDGNFIMTVVIPKDSKPGLWNFNSLNISDMAGNQSSVEVKDMVDSEVYLANTSLANEVTVVNAWYLEGEEVNTISYEEGQKLFLSWPSITIKFEEGTVITKGGGGDFGIHRIVSESYNTEEYANLGLLLAEANSELDTDIEECAVSEGCVADELNESNLVGKPVNIGKVGLPGLDLSFSKPVTVILAVDDKYLGQTLTVQTFDGISWINKATCLVKTFPPNSPGQGCGYNEETGEEECGRYASYSGCGFTTDHASFFTANVLGVTDDDRAGVPKTGLGGLRNNGLEKYIGWLK